MKRNGSIGGPMLVLAIAMVTGGWFFQQGADLGRAGFLRGRLFDQVADLVSDNYVDQVDQEQLYDAAIEGLLSSLDDPNSSFLQRDDYENFAIRTGGEYGGVGLEVLDRDGYVTVMNPIPGTPGARAGIRAGDRILEVDGEEIGEGGTDLAVERLRGQPGTEVELTIERPGVDGRLTFTVRRARVEVKSVPFHVLLEGNVGYVPLQVFSETSTDEVIAAIDSLQSEGAHGIVLDLRGNPGGVLDAGIAISELFLPASVDIVETRGRAAHQSETYRARGSGPRYPALPVAILVDERSASASEIVAGALQDHDRALLVGFRTFGKGSVQTLFPLTGGDVLKLTTARWYTPVGRSIQKEREEQRAALASGALSPFGQLVPRGEVEDLPTFTSRGGRTLMGGGGITPDLTVRPDTLDTAAQEAVYALYESGGALNQALFDFVVRRVGGAAESGRPLPEVTPALMSDLRRALEERGVEADEAVWEAAEPYLRNSLRQELALQGSGELQQFLVQAGSDQALQAALERLRAAGDDARALVTDAAAPAPAPAGAGS